MRHRKRTFRIGRRRSHVKALIANQVASLVLERRIKTTLTKAKEVRRAAERMITLGKKGTLHHRRRALSLLGNKEAVATLFDQLAPGFMARPGGYTRIIRLSERRLGEQAHRRPAGDRQVIHGCREGAAPGDRSRD